MEVLFLGTSAAVNTSDRHNTSLLVMNEANKLLIDCNGVCLQNCKKQNVDLTDLEHIFFTHAHIDHINSINNLLHQLWLLTCHFVEDIDNKRKNPINIYANTPTLEKVKMLINLVDIPKHPNMFPIIFHDLGVDEGNVSIGSLDLNYFSAQHGSFPCYSCEITAPNGKSLIYSADTEPNDALYKRLGENKVLIHECTDFDKEHLPGHTTFPEIKQSALHLSNVDTYLVHLPELTKQHFEDFNHFCKQKGLRLFIPNDGDVIKL